MRFIVFLLFLTSNLWSQAHNWGRWYAGAKPQRVDLQGDVRRIMQSGLNGRNLLLGAQKIYVNNMYPIMGVNYVQLKDILIRKNLVNERIVEYVVQSPSYGDSPVPYHDALSAFVRATITYLSAFREIPVFAQRSGEAVECLEQIYG